MGIGVLAKTVGGGVDFEAKRDESDNVQFSSTGYNVSTTLTRNNLSTTKTIQVNERMRFGKFKGSGSVGRAYIKINGNSPTRYQSMTATNSRHFFYFPTTQYGSFTTFQNQYYDSPTVTWSINTRYAGMGGEEEGSELRNSTTSLQTTVYAPDSATQTASTQKTLNGSGSAVVFKMNFATAASGTGKIKINGNTKYTVSSGGTFTKTYAGAYSSPQVTAYAHVEGSAQYGAFGWGYGTNSAYLYSDAEVTAKVYPDSTTTIT